MKLVEGIVTLAQEGRFDLVTDSGRVMAFVLAHNAGLEPQDLAPLRDGRRRVRVTYTEPHRITAYVAHSLATAVERIGK